MPTPPLTPAPYPRWASGALWVIGAWAAWPLLVASLMTLWGLWQLLQRPGEAGLVLAATYAMVLMTAGYHAIHGALIGAWIAPALLAWCAAGQRLGWLERTGAGIVVGSALLAGGAVVLPVESWERVASSAEGRWLAWGVVTASIAGPRLWCRGLRPGTFHGSSAT